MVFVQYANLTQQLLVSEVIENILVTDNSYRRPQNTKKIRQQHLSPHKSKKKIVYLKFVEQIIPGSGVRAARAVSPMLG